VLVAAGSRRLGLREKVFREEGANCITRMLRDSDVGARTNKFEEIV
jgi:hypothetical protein